MDTNKRPVVVGIGELLWDMLPGGKRAGGAPVNFVFHASQLGAEGYAISAVGCDPLGDEILGELDQNGIGYCVERVADYPTGTVEVHLKDGIPTYRIVEGVAWDHIPLSVRSKEIISRADAVCFGTLAMRNSNSRHTLMALLDNTRPDALRFFDINIRQHYFSEELIDQLLAKANVFKLNDEELDMFKPMFGLSGDEDTCCRQILQRYNLRYLVLTAGSRYSKIFAEGEMSVLPTPHVEVVDTVGAGDSFSGAFVASVLQGKSLAEAHRCAVDRAAFVCTRAGAWPKE